MTRLVDSLEPQNSKMLVRPDVRSKLAGSLHIPENVIDQVRAKSGRVLKAGPGVRSNYGQGARVLYNAHAAVTAGIDEKGELDILDDSEVSAVTDGEEEGEADEDWIPHLWPPPGMLLVERDEKRELIGSIIVPEGYKQKVRSARAVVLKAYSESGYEAGDWVLLSAGATRSFTLSAMSQRQIVRCYPGQILCKIQGRTEHELTAETSMAGIGEELLAEADYDFRFDAGDARGPR